MRVLAAGAALVAAGLAATVAVARYAEAFASLPQLAEGLRSTTLEQRRGAAYGYCEPMGYGYLAEVLRGFPDPAARPAIRYRNWDEKVEWLLPDRRDRVDERVLVGVGITQRDFAPSVVGMARRRDTRAADGGLVDRFPFRTGRDVEVLGGFVFQIAEAVPRAAELGVTLFASAVDPRALAEWTVPIPPGYQGDLFHELPVPIRRFSVNRGSTEFVLQVRRPEGVPAARAVAAIGSRLDGEGLVIVAAAGDCLTAVRRDLLDEMRRHPAGAWARFAEGLPGARLP